VSRLEVHLEKFHKEQFVSYSAKLNTRKAEPPYKKMKLDEQVCATPTFVQLSIPASTERSKQWPDDHPAVQRIEKSIMDLIVVDMLPYNVVYVVPFSFSFSAESDRKLSFSVSAENKLTFGGVSFSAVNVKPFSVGL